MGSKRVQQTRAIPEGKQPPPSRGSGGALLGRAILWAAISAVFLVWNLSRIVQMRTHLLSIPWWFFLQIVLWVMALAFWSWMGWREWKRRQSGSS